MQLNRLFKKGHISFGGAKDIRGSLKRLEIGSSLNIPELLQVAGLLENTARVKSYGRHENADTAGDSLDISFRFPGTADTALHRDPQMHCLGR